MKASTQKLVNEIVALTFMDIKDISINVTSFSEIHQISVGIYSLKGQLYTSYVLLQNTDADSKLRETLTGALTVLNNHRMGEVA